jgi:hypothetical protein
MGEDECEYDAEGRFFFDHDPTHFHLILNFMRAGECIIPYERGAFEAFKRDVQFWRLDVLEARVRGAGGGRGAMRVSGGGAPRHGAARGLGTQHHHAHVRVARMVRSMGAAVAP